MGLTSSCWARRGRRGLPFFFSSRRRNTRFKCDWSSDVCSSDLVRRAVTTPGIGFIEQTEQKGTGHAVIVGRDALARLDGYLMILYGDSPLLRTATLQRLIDQASGAASGGAAGVLMSAMMDDP